MLLGAFFINNAIRLNAGFKIMGFISQGPLPNKTCMIFIDGGYLRECLKKRWGDDKFNAGGLEQHLISFFRGPPLLVAHAELVRTYYYDAIVNESQKETRDEQKEFFKSLRTISFLETRLGQLVKSEKGNRQKGVDILMAIDMLSKAYENHYDVSVLFAGDADFVELVKAVKDAGKRVFGAYIVGHVSEELKESFDVRIPMEEEQLRKLLP